MKITDRITFTAEPEFIDKVKAAAKQQDIPLSCLIRHSLKKYLLERRNK